MAFDYPNTIGSFAQDERLMFYELFAHNLTLIIREISSDVGITDAEKVDRIKCVNEILR